MWYLSDLSTSKSLSYYMTAIIASEQLFCTSINFMSVKIAFENFVSTLSLFDQGGKSKC